MSHNHDHAGPTAGGQHEKRLTVVLVVTGAVMVAEILGAVLPGSLALLADAGHMLADAGRTYAMCTTCMPHR